MLSVNHVSWFRKALEPAVGISASNVYLVHAKFCTANFLVAFIDTWDLCVSVSVSDNCTTNPTPWLPTL